MFFIRDQENVSIFESETAVEFVENDKDDPSCIILSTL